MECKWWRLWISSGAIWELIDTLWNVNVTESLNAFMQSLRINRYIMECKCKIDCDWRQIASGINRYIMECKFNPIATAVSSAVWINRYIMECKYRLHLLRTILYMRINRYIMECKFVCSFNISAIEKRINRYIMECKFECGRCSSVKAWELIDTLWNVNIDSCLDCGYQGEN